MKTIPFALLFCFLIPQETVPPRVAEEIRKLRADDVDVRNDGTRKLTALGEEARPALQGLLQDPDADVRSRVTGIVRELDRLPRVRAAGTPAKRVTIDLKEVRLDDALRRIFEPFGIKASIQGDLEVALPVTLRLNDASFWEAFDAVSAASGFYGQNVPVKKAGDAPGELHFAGP
jgi:hypothetical protein